MLKEIFRYKGRRIRKFHLNDWLIHLVILSLPFLGLYGYFAYLWLFPLIQNFNDWQAVILPIIALLSFVGLTFFGMNTLMKLSQFRGGYFFTVRQYNMIATMLKEGGYLLESRSKNQNGKSRSRFPKVYVKRGKTTTAVTLPLDGGRYHERFLKSSKHLEEMLLADLVGEQRNLGSVTYTLMTDVISKRIMIDQVIVRDGKIKLMEGVEWSFDDMPHMLIAGGTGGGKTYFLYSLIKAFLSIGTVYICDPKSADLADLATIPVFKGKVFYGKGETMIRCLQQAVVRMEKRFKYMKSLENYQSGKNYAFYGMPPEFIFFDEWKAFYNALDYQTKDEVDKAVQQLVMKARQAGVFLILATQRPDAADFPAGVRDNLMCKITVGKLAPTGYYMVFGDENKNKSFFNKSIKGRGYILIEGGEGETDSVREFYTPLVPKGYNFLEEFKKYDEMIELDLSA